MSTVLGHRPANWPTTADDMEPKMKPPELDPWQPASPN